MRGSISGSRDIARLNITTTCSRRSRRGHVDNIRVGMETTMWMRDKSFMFRRPRTWHLAPPIDREAATHPSYGDRKYFLADLGGKIRPWPC